VRSLCAAQLRCHSGTCRLLAGAGRDLAVAASFSSPLAGYQRRRAASIRFQPPVDTGFSVEYCGGCTYGELQLADRSRERCWRREQTQPLHAWVSSAPDAPPRQRPARGPTNRTWTRPSHLLVAAGYMLARFLNRTARRQLSRRPNRRRCRRSPAGLIHPVLDLQALRLRQRVPSGAAGEEARPGAPPLDTAARLRGRGWPKRSPMKHP